MILYELYFISGGSYRSWIKCSDQSIIRCCYWSCSSHDGTKGNFFQVNKVSFFLYVYKCYLLSHFIFIYFIYIFCYSQILTFHVVACSLRSSNFVIKSYFFSHFFFRDSQAFGIDTYLDSFFSFPISYQLGKLLLSIFLKFLYSLIKQWFHNYCRHFIFQVKLQ